MSEQELKPCPFCGADAQEPVKTYARCSRMDCPAGSMIVHVELWNKRPSPPLAVGETRGSSEWKWLPLDSVVDAIKKLKPHSWCSDWGLKYIDLRIDTRDFHCLIKDGRSGEQVTIERIIKASEYLSGEQK